MLYGAKVVDEEDNLYRVIRLIRFRKTDKVTFDMVSTDLIGNVNAIDQHSLLRKKQSQVESLL